MIKIVFFVLSLLLLAFTMQGHDSYPNDKLDSIKYYNYLQQRETARLYIKQAEYNEKVHDFNIANLDYLKMRYRWHSFASEVIFWLVIFIVLCGIGFSGIQFYKSIAKSADKLNVSSNAKPDQAVQNLEGAQQELPQHINVPQAYEKQPSTTFKLSVQGVEVSSSILGVIILTMSIAFFYLYLIYVYPMRAANSEPSKIEEVVK